MGLQLDVRDASVELVLVQEQYDNAAILIVDDDGQLLLHNNIIAQRSENSLSSTVKLLCTYISRLMATTAIKITTI